MKKKKTDETKKKKTNVFNRGYSGVREKIGKGSRYTMSCFNCEHFFKDFGDVEEVCQNPDVLKYDMVVTPTNVYCNRWELSYRVTSAKQLFKKGKQ